jgi:spore germination protein KB
MFIRTSWKILSKRRNKIQDMPGKFKTCRDPISEKNEGNLEKKYVISIKQLISMLLVSQIVVCVTFGSRLVGGGDIWDCVISCIIAFFITFLLAIPVYCLCKTETQSDISDISDLIFKGAGKIITIIYAAYFILVCAHTLAIFKSFIENVMNPPVSFLLLSAGMILFACYGASKGIEGLARASAVVLFFITVALFVLGTSLFKAVDFTNLKPFFYSNRFETTVKGLMFFISRSSFIPAMALLLSKARGNAKEGIFYWNFAFYALMVSSIFLVTGTLGDFAATRLFPVYSMASIAKIGSLENLDALYLGLWTSAVFMKISLFMNLSAECIRKTFGRKHKKTIIIGIGLLLVFTNKFIKISNVSSGIFSTGVLLIFTFLTAVIIPVLLIILKQFKKDSF